MLRRVQIPHSRYLLFLILGPGRKDTSASGPVALKCMENSHCRLRLKLKKMWICSYVLARMQNHNSVITQHESSTAHAGVLSPRTDIRQREAYIREMWGAKRCKRRNREWMRALRQMLSASSPKNLYRLLLTYGYRKVCAAYSPLLGPV